MRFGRWLSLAAIVTILAFVAVTYQKHKAALASAAPARPDPLEAGTEGLALDYSWGHTDGDCPRARIHAAKFREIHQPSVMELEGLELKLYKTDCTTYNLIKSEKAQFDINGRSMYSEGEVDITMGVPEDAPQHGRLLKIHTSGARFSVDSGTATTDRPATFEFDAGSGSATGADYDPNTRELHLHSAVKLDWRGRTPGAKPMHAEAGEAMYRERESKVILYPWSKLTRETLRLDAGMSVVLLEDGNIKHAEVQTARGVQDDPGRQVEFGADKLYLDFGDAMQISQVHGVQHSRLVSTSATARTTVTSDNVELNFIVADHESVLDTGVSTGNSVAESEPVTKTGAQVADTRVLRSDTISLKMRAGGKEMASAETAGPGTLDFLPNRPEQSKRSLKGDRIWIVYGAENRIQSFRSTNVSTRTEKPPPAGKPVPPPALTESKEILATFDPVTSELTRVEQKTDFHYQEGDQQARANVAVLDQQKNLMTLDGGSRFWDPTGSVNADHILMNEKTGDYTAEGHVASTRQPDKKGDSSAMLSNQEVLQAQGQKMVSTNQNKKIHYEGNAVAWQGANRVRADRLDIDRDRRVMEAHGNVTSEFVDKSKADPGTAKTGAKPAPAVFTKVRAADLVYTEETRVAVYQGGTSMVRMERPGLVVDARQMQAFLKDSDSDSSLDKVLADGAVKMVSTTSKKGGPVRIRTATSEHGEYYADETKVVMTGGEPLFVDSLKGDKTTGKQLTWWEKDDRLLNEGGESRPAQSTLHKK